MLKRIYPTIITGSVTRANMRISAVDGTAFVDFSSAGSLTPYTGCEIWVIDSAGKAIQGYIKAVGSGETLGDELIDDPTFDDDTKWSAQAGWSVSGGKAIAAGTDTTTIYQKSVKSSAIGKLGKIQITCDTWVSGSYCPRIDGVYHTNYASTGVKTLYANIRAGSTFGAIKLGTNDFTFTDITLKPVLTPSTTGVTIVSTREGATYNWLTKDASFNYNDASGYTYRIKAFKSF